MVGALIWSAQVVLETSLPLHRQTPTKCPGFLVERPLLRARQRWRRASDVNTWYRSAPRHIAQNWPFDVVRYWRQTREPRPDDYGLR